MTIYAVHPSAPYNTGLLLAFLRRFTTPALNIVHGDHIRRVLHLEGVPTLVEVDCSTTPLQITQHDTPGQQNTLPGALPHPIRHWLGMDDDLTPFYAYIAQNARLSALLGDLIGLPLLRTENLFEALISIIIEQHISWVAAQGAQQRLVQALGTPIKYDGHIYYAMPTPEQIANAPEAALNATKITYKRQALLRDIAERFLSGKLDTVALQQLAPQALYETLLQIKGIGHWTAACVVSRATGHYGYVLHNDVALQAAVNHYFLGGKGRIPGQQLIDILSEYEPYAGLIAHFIIIKWVLEMYPPTS